MRGRLAENERLRGFARASYAAAERTLATATAIAEDFGVEAGPLAPRVAAVSVVTGLRELYDSHDARSLGPQPTGSDLVRLVNQVIDLAAAGLAAITNALFDDNAMVPLPV